MTPLDDSYRFPPGAEQSNAISAIAQGFFELGLDTFEIARELRMKERDVVRFVHAIENERRAERLRESA
jgi:hypothetical protein